MILAKENNTFKTVATGSGLFKCTKAYYNDHKNDIPNNTAILITDDAAGGDYVTEDEAQTMIDDAVSSNFQTGTVVLDGNDGTSTNANKSITFTTPFDNNNYILNIIPNGGYGYASVQWAISNKSASGFTIEVYRGDGQYITTSFAPRYVWQAYKLPGE